MVTCVAASIDLPPLARDNISYIAGHRVAARTEAELRYPVPFLDPQRRETVTNDLIPHVLFALEHHTLRAADCAFP